MTAQHEQKQIISDFFDSQYIFNFLLISQHALLMGIVHAIFCNGTKKTPLKFIASSPSTCTLV